MKARYSKTMPVCPACKNRTKINAQRDKYRVDDQDIHHDYLLCEHCGNKATICWTDHIIRTLLARQKTEHTEQLAEAISEKMVELEQKMTTHTPLQ